MKASERLIDKIFSGEGERVLTKEQFHRLLAEEIDYIKDDLMAQIGAWLRQILLSFREKEYTQQEVYARLMTLYMQMMDKSPEAALEETRRISEEINEIK